MTRRPGMSLTEVLVALFILTIGVIGILTMFPLGAAQMARAVRDDRSAQAAQQADGFMRWYWQTYVVDPTISPGLVTKANQNLGYAFPTGSLDVNFVNGTGLFDMPGTWGMTPTTAVLATSQGTAAAPMTVANLIKGYSGLNFGQVSYPVIVDPMGMVARPYFFGDNAGTGFAAIPRCGLAQLANANLANAPGYYRSCSLTDSLGYNDDGLPTPDLEMRYNWFWVLQRPQAIAENWYDLNNQNILNMFNALTPGATNQLSNVNMTVVVFDRRALGYPNANVRGFETVLQATFTTGLTAVTIPAISAADAMDLKPGSWVMDASSQPAAVPYPIRQANFYRVVSVTPAGGNVTLELQAPIGAPPGYNPFGYVYGGTLVALNGVSGVFVRPPLTPYPQ